MLELLKLLILQVTIIMLPIDWTLPDNFWKCNDKYIWTYNIQTKTITVCKWKKIKYALLHELWHQFWYYNITEEERNKYINLYYQAILRNEKVILENSNYLENFAWDFTYFYLKNKNNNDRIKYIKELIIKYK